MLLSIYYSPLSIPTTDPVVSNISPGVREYCHQTTYLLSTNNAYLKRHLIQYALICFCLAKSVIIVESKYRTEQNRTARVAIDSTYRDVLE